MPLNLNDCKVLAIDPDFSFEEIGLFMFWRGMNHNAFVGSDLLLPGYFKRVIFRSNERIRIVSISSSCRFTRHELVEDMGANKPRSSRGNNREDFRSRRAVFHGDDFLCDSHAPFIVHRIGSN